MATRKSAITEFVDLADKAYNNVYQKFKQVAEFEKTQLFSPVASQAFIARKSDLPHRDSVEVNGALRISHLPHSRTRVTGASRPKDKKSEDNSKHANKLVVLLESQDIYKFDGKPASQNSFLYSSVVRMAYFQPVFKKWKPLFCVRYDFGKSEDAHPVFHAQLEDGVPSKSTRQLFGDIPDIEDALKVHPGVRLPTANVIGATALLSLAADHLPLKEFPNILRVVKQQSIFRGEWRCGCETLDSYVAPRAMLASEWYSPELRGAT